MSDHHLRHLERAASHDGPEARAAWIRARLRAGTITREWVELAAYCGDEGARIVLGWPLSDDPPRFGYPTHPAASFDGKTVGSTNDFGIWLRGLSRWGREVEERAQRAIAARSGCRGCADTRVQSLKLAYDCANQVWLVPDDDLRAAVSAELIRWAIDI